MLGVVSLNDGACDCLAMGQQFGLVNLDSDTVVAMKVNSSGSEFQDLELSLSNAGYSRDLFPRPPGNS